MCTLLTGNDMKDKVLKILLWTLGALLASIALSVVYYCIFSLVFYTDVERQLADENHIYRKELPALEKNAHMVREELEYLRYRDEAIYEKVFKADAPSVNELIEGDILTDDSDNGGNIVKQTFRKSGAAMDKASSVEENWRAVFQALEGRDYAMPPLTAPVRGLAYTNVGASVGIRLSPFYKSLMQHDGIDLIAPSGTPVFATASGVVSRVQRSDGGKGNMVEIRHRNGFVTRYAHLNSTLVGVGATVRPGTRIGTVGDSGRAFTTHLHYEVEKDGNILDPVHFFLGSVSPDEYLKMLIMSVSSGQSMD